MINLVISYDYELAWGVWDNLPADYIHNNVSNSNDCASALLDLHEKQELKATWAIVGSAISVLKPERLIELDLAGSNEIEKRRNKIDLFSRHEMNKDTVSIPSSIVDKIKGSRYFEFASHTFSHNFSNEQDKEKLRKDFTFFNDVCGDTATASIVFPRNIVTEDALEICAEFDVKIVRVNPNNVLYRAVRKPGVTGSIIRVLRYIDSFIPLQEFLPERASDIESHGCRLCIGQYFFRPNSGGVFRDWLHRHRLILGLRICIARNTDFHLWSHPHNFGGDAQLSLNNCELLFKKLRSFVDNGSAVSSCMCELDSPDKAEICDRKVAS